MAALLDGPAAATAPSLAHMAVVGVHVAAALAAVWLLLCTTHDTVMAARGGVASRSPRWIRRVVNNAVGTALMVGLLAGPAAAATEAATEAPTEVATDAPTEGATEAPTEVATDPVPEVSPDFTDPETGPPAASITVPVPIVAPTPRPPAPTSPPTPEAPEDEAVDPAEAAPEPATQSGQPTHEVAAGENLWVIARAQLLDAGIDAPSDRDVHAYWVRLIAANLDGLRSGDPDLIFPGETLVLPATDGTTP